MYVVYNMCVIKVWILGVGPNRFPLWIISHHKLTKPMSSQMVALSLGAGKDNCTCIYFQRTIIQIDGKLFEFFLKLMLSWQICLIYLPNLPNSVKIKNPLNISKFNLNLVHFELRFRCLL